MSVEIEDFVLVVARAEDHFMAQGYCQGVGQIPYVKVRAEALASIAERASRLGCGEWQEVGAADRIGRALAEADRIGRALYDVVFAGGIDGLFRRAVERARARMGLIRLVLQYEPCPELHELPWELLCDGETYLALSRDLLLVRYLSQEREVRSLLVAPSSPLRVLLTSACPEGMDRLDLEAEHQQVERALRPHEPKVQLKGLQRARLEEVEGLLRRGEDRAVPFHVWHHCGHGGFPEDRPGFHLAFEADESGDEYAPTAALAGVVASLPHLRLAFLNVCHGGAAAGLATSLATLNVPAVIGFRTAVLDRVALCFSRVLYGELLRHPVDWAVREARRELCSTGVPLAWSLPLLFLRATDAHLLPSPNRP